MKALTAALLTLAALMGGVLAYRTYAPAPLHGTALDVPHPLRAVTLTSDAGQPVNLADSGGRQRLVFFGYTRCPDVCPLTLGVLAHAWDSLSANQQAKLRVQVITVDPKFDRPAVLQRYLRAFSPDFQGLTGSDAAIKAAEQSLYVYAAQGQGPTAMIHGDGVALIDEQGRFVRVYDNDAVAQGQLSADLPQLLK